MSNYLRFSPRTNVTNANNQTIYIKMSQIRTVINDVSYSIAFRSIYSDAQYMLMIVNIL